jgi:hypothetical protein
MQHLTMWQHQHMCHKLLESTTLSASMSHWTARRHRDPTYPGCGVKQGLCLDHARPLFTSCTTPFTPNTPPPFSASCSPANLRQGLTLQHPLHLLPLP